MRCQVPEIKKKLINSVMLEGRKETSEKLLLKSFKNFQKLSKKKVENFFIFSLINATPAFKLHQSSNKNIKKKKRQIRLTPVFIYKHKTRVALGIKWIINNLRDKKVNKIFVKSFQEEILNLIKSVGVVREFKNDYQKKVLLNKRSLKNYRW